MQGQHRVPMSRGSVRRPPPSVGGRSRATVARQGPPPGQKRPSALPVSKPWCNKCIKPIRTQAFVCACNCLLCGDCGEAHFSINDFCPVCKARLGSTGIALVAVTNPPVDEPPQVAAKKAGFQTLFQKETINSRDLSFKGMKGKLFAQIDQVGRASKFVVMQVMRDAALHARRSANTHQLNQKLKSEVEQQAQELNSLRQQNRMELANQVEQVNTQAQTIRDLTQQLDEQEKLLAMFRQRAVSSSSSVQSGDQSQNSGSTRHQYHQQPPPQRQAPVAPMAIINQQKAAEVRRLQERLNPSQSQMLSRNRNDGGSYQSSTGASSSYHTASSRNSVHSNSMHRSRPVSSMGGSRQSSHLGPGFHISGSQSAYNPKRRRVGISQSVSGRSSLAHSTGGSGRVGGYDGYHNESRGSTGYH